MDRRLRARVFFQPPFFFVFIPSTFSHPTRNLFPSPRAYVVEFAKGKFSLKRGSIKQSGAWRLFLVLGGLRRMNHLRRLEETNRGPRANTGNPVYPTDSQSFHSSRFFCASLGSGNHVAFQCWSSHRLALRTYWMYLLCEGYFIWLPVRDFSGWILTFDIIILDPYFPSLFGFDHISILFFVSVSTGVKKGDGFWPVYQYHLEPCHFFVHY